MFKGPDRVTQSAGFRGLRRWAVARTIVVAVGLIAVAILLRIAFLGDRQLFRDEAASWLTAHYPLPDLVAHTSHEAYPPLYFLVLKGWTWLAGDGEAALRSLSVLFGLAMVLIGWRWATESLGRRAGLVALAFLAISPLAIANARDARMYAMESAFTTLAWWLTWRLASGRSQGRRRWVDAMILAIAVAVELWTFSFGLPVAGLQLAVAGVPWIRHRLPSNTIPPAAILLGAATFLPWLPKTIAASGGRPFWTPVPTLPGLGETFAVMIGGVRFPWTVGAYAVFGLAVIGVVALVRGRVPIQEEPGDSRRRLPMLGVAVVAGLALVPAVWLYSQFHSFYDSRYFGAALAPLALATAAGWCWASSRITPVLARRAAGGAVALLLLGGTVTWLNDWRSEVGLAPGRELVAGLEERMQPGDVALSLDSRSYFQVAYLLGRDRMPERLPGPLLSWDSGSEPFYFGGNLLPPGAVVSDGEIRADGWRASLPGLAPGGRIWLIALANGASEDLGFQPLDAGELREIARLFLAPAGETGQVRELVIAAPE